jgi:hypothetical protein
MIYYLDTQNGNVLFLRLLESTPKILSWINYRPISDWSDLAVANEFLPKVLFSIIR